MTAGHLFVVHGKIEHLVHDAAVLPVDGILDFNEIWRPLLGDPWPERPTTWARGWGRVTDRSQWLVQVGDGSYDRVLDRLSETVADIVQSGLGAAGGRALPLVALPVLGVGRGGHAHERGRVLRELVSRASNLCRAYALDIALVTPEASVYAAAQFARSEFPSPLTDVWERAAWELGQKSLAGELALFLGAGVSIPAGLPSWHELVQRLAKGLTKVSPQDLAALQVSATDQAALIETAAPRAFQRRVASIAREATRPSLLHGLLAGLDAKQVITTNYDCLYEQAVKASSRAIASVMPWASGTGAARWVLKLHGDVAHEKTIVLTRRHMVRYDAANRPSAALLQSVFLTKHVLVVGASLTDDNVVRLALEVQAYREEHMGKTNHPVFGTVLDASVEGDRVRARLWKDQMAWRHLTDVGTTSSTRALELFLDRVGLHARSDSAWVLDERFSDLLPDARDKALAERVRQLHRDLATRREGPWRSLVTSLEDHGATSLPHP